MVLMLLQYANLKKNFFYEPDEPPIPVGYFSEIFENFRYLALMILFI